MPKTKVSTFKINESTEKLFSMHPDYPMSKSLNLAIDRYVRLVDTEKKILKMFKAAEKRHIKMILLGMVNDWDRLKNAHTIVRASVSKKVDVKMVADKLKSLSPLELVALCEFLGV